MVISDKKIGVDAGLPIMKPVGGVDYYLADVLEVNSFYPFGSQAPGRTARVGDGYRFGFNGKRMDNEIKGTGNSYDYGDRIYDPRTGRWLSLDKLAREYPSVSDYSFALNTPIQAKDPDGKVVLFINGQHGGSGGQAKYWDRYDQKVMNRLGDHNVRYIDGALGGWKNTGANAGIGAIAGSPGAWVGSLTGAAIGISTSSNVSMKVRIEAGYAQGLVDAESVFASMKEGESIKIVTHSMGTAFSRGYVEGLTVAAHKLGQLDKLNFEYQLDVNSFQGADLPPSPLVKQTQNKTGGLDGGNSLIEMVQGNSVPTVAAIPGADDTSTDADRSKGHSVSRMSIKGIPKLGNGGDDDSVEQGNNNERTP